jgi:hypothetical protein
MRMSGVRRAVIAYALVASAFVALAFAGLSAASPTAGRPCDAAQLRASMLLQGATGHLVGALILRNGGRACTLTGRPQLTLVRADGRTVRTRNYDAPPRWRFVTDRPPRGWPVVRLGRGDRASVWIALTNWCHGNGERVRFDVRLPNRAAVGTTAARIYLRCESASAPVSLGVGPFERVDS